MKPTKEEVYPYLAYDVECVLINLREEVNERYTVNASNVSDLLKYNNVKLVLRPLSDLTDEYIDKNCKGYKHYFSRFRNPTTSKQRGYVSAYDSYLPLDQFEWLIKRHFDVFRLIPQGKAIDKNTL